MKRKLFSVSIKDCEVQTFTVGGPGGGGKDTSNTGVRIVHPPSGAVGEGREERSQLANKRAAFVRLAKSPIFVAWCKRKAAGLQNIDEVVDADMQPHNLKVEYRDEQGRWYELKR